MKFQSRNNYIINWPEYPLIRITVCFIIGIYLSDQQALSLNHSFVLTIVLVIVYMLITWIQYSSRAAIRSLSMLVIFIGMALGVFRGNLQKGSNHPNHYLNYVKDGNLIVGKVINKPKKKNRISTFLELSQINGRKSSGKILVYFGKTDSLVDYSIGDELLISGKVQILKDNPNPGSFNYKDYLKYKGVDAQVFLKDGMHGILKIGNSNIVYQSALEIRSWALAIFEKRLNDQDQLATASAMVLGYREHLSEDLYTSFSETGAVHILAVSGLHVGIICMIFLFIFNRIKSEHIGFKILKLITLLIVVWLYALVTGASPAVLRASVMFSFILVGRLWFHRTNIYNILVFSALILLIYDPYLLFQLSFQFSYLALISIVFFQPLIEKWYETTHWITTKVWQLTTVSIAAQILVFPISVYYFHKFPTYFILSGVAAVFIATFILGLGLLLIGFDRVPVVGDIISATYGKLLETFIQIISGIQSLPLNNVEGIYISKASVLILYILIGFIMLLVSIKPKKYKDVFHKKLKRKKVSKLVIATCIVFLFSNNMLFSFRVKNHKELIVYDISKNTAIDIFCHDKAYTYQSAKIDKSKVEFASKAYRIYHGNPEIFDLNTSLNVDPTHFIKQDNGSLIFKNKHIIFADRVDLDKPIPCSSDLTLLVNGSTMLPYQFLDVHTTPLVVIDKSISFKVKNQWRKACEKRNILVHDISKDGVYIIQ